MCHPDSIRKETGEIPDKTTMPTLQTNEKSRDSLYDNIRCFLILLVVFGHMLSPIEKKDFITQSIYWVIYSVHMPAFILISGFFSKNVDKCRDTAFAKFFIPYIVVDLIKALYDLLSAGKAVTKLNLFTPRWGVWFLLAMFVWRFFLKDLIKIRYILPVSFVIGILAGCFPAFDSAMSVGRIFGFLPFFIVGYYIDSDFIAKLRKLPKWIPLLTILVCAVGTVFACRYKLFPHQFFFLRDAYTEYKVNMWMGMVWRLAIYAVSFIMTFSLIAVFPNKSGYWSFIGKNTLPVYVLHLFIVPHLKNLSFIKGKDVLHTALAFVIALALVLILSSKPVVFCYNKIADFIEQLVLPKKKNKETA